MPVPCTSFPGRGEKDEKIAHVVVDEILGLLQDTGFEGWQRPAPAGSKLNPEITLAHLAEHVTAGELAHLLLAKETLERMLIYGRYGARARKAEEG